MRIKQLALRDVSIAFFLTIISLTFLYGPWKRSYNEQPLVLTVETSEQIAPILKKTGVKGRVAICFTRYLNAVEGKESTDLKVTERSMESGIFRKVYHTAPDNAWPEIRSALSKMNGVRTTQDGYIGIFENGRVYINPLSSMSQVSEKALIILEPKVWSPAELLAIAEKLRSGSISSDLVVIIRGTEQDAALFRRALIR
jgi:hypothetical protein